MVKPDILLVLGMVFSISTSAQTLEDRANNFLNSLKTTQKKEIVYPYENQERFNWHYVPRSRNGIALYDLNEDQRKAVLLLVEASLSAQGNTKVKDILELEDILRAAEGRPAGDDYRDQLNYAVTFFGTPSKTNPWGWRLEGHHLSLNFTSVNGLIVSSTPSFFGANPATISSGKNRGKQTLRLEAELAFSLLNQLTDEQRNVAVISTSAPYDIITGNDRKAKQPEKKGILYSALNESQKKSFLQLLDVYVKNYELGFSSTLMKKIEKAGIANLSFAWAGSLKPGAGHYYRIQGPMLLIEYDNTQNSGNHIHSVVRDLTNDFAEDILKEHYKKEH
ncbi:MAG TPA: DUF3500 domain-containing protein [Ohtaekwangia sp.]